MLIMRRASHTRQSISPSTLSPARHLGTEPAEVLQSRFKGIPSPPTFNTLQEESVYVRQRLAAGFRLFSKFGFDEGVAGHITVRDPVHTDTFWVNPFGTHFSQIKVSNLIRVNHAGEIVEGGQNGPLNLAAFAIHSTVHAMRPDVHAAAHTHSVYGRTFSTLGKPLSMITQDACAFLDDHAVYDDFGGVAIEMDEGHRIGKALGPRNKAIILQNHGLLTVGASVDAAVWWYLSLERCCQVELLARSTGVEPKTISAEAAAQARTIVGSPRAGWFSFQPLYARIVKEQPDLLN
jgi:ribulose-5-phosphate 4-epimerase/fuculose-1-phosphate aldolase